MRSQLKRVGLLASACTLVAAATAARGAVSLASFTGIQTPDPGHLGFVFAQGISPTGQIVGYYQFTQNPSAANINEAFSATVSGGTANVQLLGHLPGPVGAGDDGTDSPGDPNFGFKEGWAFAANGAKVVGTGTGGSVPVWNNQQFNGTAAATDLGAIQNNATNIPVQGFNFAAGVSDNGTVVGGSWYNPKTTGNAAVNRLHAYVNTPAAGYIDLTPQAVSGGYTSAAYAINRNGDIAVGFETSLATTGTNSSGAAATSKGGKIWRLSGSTWNSFDITPLPGGSQAVAYGVNNAGQVVGVSEADTGMGVGGDAFLRQPDGTMVDLMPGSGAGFGSLGNPVGTDFHNLENQAGNILNSAMLVGSVADAINDDGWIVGRANGRNAYLWTVDASDVVTAINLNDLLPANSGWELAEATGINDAGQIVGWGSFDGTEASWAMQVQPAAVPEPTLALPIAATAGLLVRRTRR